MRTIEDEGRVMRDMSFARYTHRARTSRSQGVMGNHVSRRRRRRRLLVSRPGPGYHRPPHSRLITSLLHPLLRIDSGIHPPCAWLFAPLHNSIHYISTHQHTGRIHAHTSSPRLISKLNPLRKLARRQPLPHPSHSPLPLYHPAHPHPCRCTSITRTLPTLTPTTNSARPSVRRSRIPTPPPPPLPWAHTAPTRTTLACPLNEPLRRP